jgi:hypothetical protein
MDFPVYKNQNNWLVDRAGLLSVGFRSDAE